MACIRTGTRGRATCFGLKKGHYERNHPIGCHCLLARSRAKKWFGGGAAFDAQIQHSFGETHLIAARGDLASWEGSAEGALALLLLLTDQFPRNLYRKSAHAFATDEMARGIANRAPARGLDIQTEASLRAFFYLPFEHHENAASKARAVALFEKLGDKLGLDYAKLHADLITRFGRFPHRNAVMRRVSTPEEIAYLAQGGFVG